MQRLFEPQAIVRSYRFESVLLLDSLDGKVPVAKSIQVLMGHSEDFYKTWPVKISTSMQHMSNVHVLPFALFPKLTIPFEFDAYVCLAITDLLLEAIFFSTAASSAAERRENHPHDDPAG